MHARMCLRCIVHPSPSYVYGIESRQVGHALLDVFQEEPLPPTSPLWLHPGIRIVPHVASATQLPVGEPSAVGSARQLLMSAMISAMLPPSLQPSSTALSHHHCSLQISRHCPSLHTLSITTPFQPCLICLSQNAVSQIRDNYVRMLQKQPFLNVADRARGY